MPEFKIHPSVRDYGSHDEGDIFGNDWDNVAVAVSRMRGNYPQLNNELEARNAMYLRKSKQAYVGDIYSGKMPWVTELNVSERAIIVSITHHFMFLETITDKVIVARYDGEKPLDLTVGDEFYPRPYPRRSPNRRRRPFGNIYADLETALRLAVGSAVYRKRDNPRFDNVSSSWREWTAEEKRAFYEKYDF